MVILSTKPSIDVLDINVLQPIMLLIFEEVHINNSDIIIIVRSLTFLILPWSTLYTFRPEYAIGN